MPGHCKTLFIDHQCSTSTADLLDSKMFSSMALACLLGFTLLSIVGVFYFTTILLLTYLVFGATTGTSHSIIPVLLIVLAGVSHSLRPHHSRGSEQPAPSEGKGSSDGAGSDSASTESQSPCATPTTGELCLDLLH